MPVGLRPHPHRGDTLAAGVVVLVIFTAVLETRFADAWSDGARLLVVLALAAPVLAMALSSELLEERPRPYQAVLYVAAFVMVLFALEELAQVLGSSRLRSPGTVVWIGLALAAFAGFFAARRNSAIMTLLAVLTLVVVANAFVDWVFKPHGIETYRWVLLACALALALGATAQRDLRRRHAVALVDVAGLSVIALGLTLTIQQALSALSGILGSSVAPAGGPAGWELVLLAFGSGLIAYGAVDRERVPAGLGVVVLSLFVTEAARPGRDGASLIGWPIVLLLVALALLATGLRPRRELPPEPPVGGTEP